MLMRGGDRITYGDTMGNGFFTAWVWLLSAMVVVYSPANANPAGDPDSRDYHRRWYTPSTAVTFNDWQRRSDPLAVFYDREGDLYPSAAIPISTQRLIGLFDNPEDAGTLRGYFKREAQITPDIVSTLAEDAGIARRDLPDLGWSEANWRRIQSAYRDRAAAHIAEAAKGRAIAFIVHGYRNNFGDARKWYEPLDEMVRTHDQAATIVHVYWDGLTGWRFLNLWKKAQYNMAFIGLEFRRLLNRFPADTPIRIITHSTGAPLVANALGDASEAFLDNGKPVLEEREYYTRAAGVDGPDDEDSYVVLSKHRLRYAAIAPAASLDTFERYRFPRDIAPERISMALNNRDSATGKYFMNCELYGSSCMAVKPGPTCTLLVEKFGPAGTEVGIFDFGRGKPPTPRTALWSKHSVKAYAQNERWSSFLRHILTDASVPTDTQATCLSGM